MSDQRIGTEIAGYRILEVIGRGGMGVVYLAEQASPRRKVALKILATDLAADPAFRQRFIRESDAAASIEHPNIVPIHQAGEQDGVLFIAMRYVEGTDLRSLLDREGPLPAERAVSVVTQVAAALDAAHESGLVHRDVKPGNVLVGRGEHAYLTDFGLIKRPEAGASLTRTGQFMGTVDYVAPEQIRGEPVDGRADVYSLGCLLYECLTGKPPFPSDLDVTGLYAHLEQSPPAVTAKRPELPPAIDAVVAMAMAKRPEDRYATAGDMAAAARAALSAEPSHLAPARPSPRPRRPGLIAGAGAAVVVVVAVAVGIALSRHNHATTLPSSTPSATASSPAVAPVNSVLEIDPASGKVLHTTRHPATNPGGFGLAIGEGGVWLGTLSPAGVPSLLHIDEETGGVRATIPTAFDLGVGAVVAAGYQSVWVPGMGSLQVIDPATDRTVDRLHFGSHGTPSALALGDRSVWVGFNDGTLLRIDPGSRDVVDEIPVGGSIDLIAVDRTAVWALDRLDNMLWRVDPDRSRVTGSVHVGGDLAAMTVGFGSVWILDSAAGTVVPIDPGTIAPGAQFRVGNHPFDIAVGLGAVWVTDQADGNIYRIDPSTRDVSTVHVRSQLGAIVIDAHARTIWVDVA